MGMSMNCQLVENDEELIHSLLRSINLFEIDSLTAYKKYRTCLIPSSSHLKKEDYQKFVTAILGNSKYKPYQERFFMSLREEFPDEAVIGTMIIFLSKGLKDAKMSLLIEHYKLNASSVDLTHFIKDIIKANTEHCLKSFKDCFDGGNYYKLSEIYSEQRLEYMCLWIMRNYNEINQKHNDKAQHHNDCDCIDDDSTTKETSDDDLKLKDFFEIVYEQLEGEFIRNWLYEDYLKEKPKIRVPCE